VKYIYKPNLNLFVYISTNKTFSYFMNKTNQELLEISLKIERDGKKFYSELAEKIKDK
jgi:rubrerythrin